MLNRFEKALLLIFLTLPTIEPAKGWIGGQSGGALQYTSTGDNARKQVRQVPVWTVVDAHNDVLLRMMEGEDIGVRTQRGHSDLPRFREGGVNVQVFSVWVDPEFKERAYQRANEMIDSLESLVRHHPEEIGIARSADEAERLVREGKLAALIGLEGGVALDSDLARIDSLYHRGVRYIALTWNDTTPWASSAEDEVEHPEKFQESSKSYLRPAGLTALGRAAIHRMNELGIMVDVSHLGERSFWDIIHESTKPIIASHSCAYSLAHHYRNLKDDQIRAIAKSGGIVCINFYPGYLDSSFERSYAEILQKHTHELDSLQALYREDHAGYVAARRSLLKNEIDSIRPPLSRIVDHIEYIVKLVGIDYVGLGSDFDGIGVTPIGLKDVTDFPRLTRELLDRGFSPPQVRKILGENFLRVFRQVCGKRK